MADVEYKNVVMRFDDGTEAVREFSLKIDDGELMVLVGPSGCGKSTLLRLLAGLETPSSGLILIDGKVVNTVSPQGRNAAMVFQNYALYPHMTVRGNLGFPLKMQKRSKTDVSRLVERTAGLLGLDDLLDRKPGQLSGGQRQRVAMGRAIVRDPAVFLMDEPLSNLDARLRVQIRGDIAALQKEMRTTTIYVTHDQVEAMTLGDRVCVLRDGELQQVDTPQNMYDKPINLFVAKFMGNPGMNLIPANLHVDDGALFCTIGTCKVPVAGKLSDRKAPVENQPVIAGIRPEGLSPIESRDARDGILLQVETVEALGHDKLIYGTVSGTDTPAPKEIENLLQDLDPSPQRLAARLPGDYSIETGARISLGIGAHKLHLFDLDGKALI